VLEELRKLTYSIARGVPQAATGFVDLAALPLTLSGMIKPEDVVGSTDYLTKLGLLPKPEQGLLPETTELVSSLLSPGGATKAALVGAGGLLGDAILTSGALERLPPPVGSIANPININKPKDLMFVKNTGKDAIRNYSLLGGMPVPSLGIIQKDQPFDKFGKISLIGKPEKFDPKIKENVAYTSDIYSTREPKPFYLANKNSSTKILDDYEITKEITGKRIDAYGIDEDLEKLSTKKNASGYLFNNVKEFFQYRAEPKAKFLLEQGIDLPVLKKPKKVLSEKQQQALIKKANLSGEALQVFKEQLKKENNPNIVKKIYYNNSDLEKIIQDNNLTDQFDEWVQREQSDYFKRSGDAFFKYENPNYEQQSARLSDLYNKTNDYRVEQEISKQLENLERNRYKVADYTVDNLTKVMKKMPTIGAEEGLGTTGIGRMKAGVTKQLKSLDDIQANRGLLASNDQLIKDKVSESFDEIANEIVSDLNKLKIDTPYGMYDSISSLMIDGLDKGGKKTDFEKAFKGTLFEKTINEKTLQKMQKFAEQLKSSPAEYFESKPQRTVPLSDFSGAIVPEDSPQGLLNMLEEQGIKVEKYKTQKERTKLKEKFKDSMFDLGAFLGTGLLGSSLITNSEEEQVY
jgi:hypothetical protein